MHNYTKRLLSDIADTSPGNLFRGFILIASVTYVLTHVIIAVFTH